MITTPHLHHPSSELSRLKRLALTAFLIGVAVNALLAIGVILGGIGGESDWKIISTSLLLTVGSIGVIGNAAGHERGTLGWLPLAAGSLVGVSVAMTLVAIWGENDSEVYYQWLGTFSIAAMAGTYASLISLPQLKREHRWLQWAAGALAALFGSVVIYEIWTLDGVNDKLLAILGVLLAAVTIVVPVVARAFRAMVSEPENPAAWLAYCPICGAPLDPSSETTQQCDRCATTFHVEVLASTGHAPTRTTRTT